MPNIINTIKKKRTNENYKEILNDYLKINNSHLSTNRTNKMNSSFFDNITNNDLQKRVKLKNLVLKISQKNINAILKYYYHKWQIKENDKKINAGNCIQDKINHELNGSNGTFNFNKINENKMEEISIIPNNNIFKDIKNIENGAKKSLEFDENIFLHIEETNNNSINLNNENDNNVFKEIKKDKVEKQIIEDDFDIKINEEMIINQKENSKLKSDVFDSNDMNSSSLYMKDKSNINENTYINSPEKIKNQSRADLLEINNEICNISNANTYRDSMNPFKNSNISEIKCDKSNKEKEKINNINKNELNKIKENREKFKEEIRKTFNKNVIFDSLENIDCNNNIPSYCDKNRKEIIIKSNTVNNISKTKKQILNHFMTENPNFDNKFTKNKPVKRYFYKISSTNNIFLKNKFENIDFGEMNDKNSFSNTNLTKIENIYIKGNKNINQTKTEDMPKKKLQLFIMEKNNDIQINQNTKETKKEINKGYELIIGNNITKNNLYDRIIDSNMINNFLKNTKNEPMFQKKNFQTIQSSNPPSKMNFNINNIINFSINKKNPKVHTEENKNKSNNYNTLNNNFIYERKNHFYLKKALNLGKNKNNNINKIRNISNRLIKNNNLKLNELELIEPNIQKCPVSLRKEKNDYYKERKSNGIKKDNMFYIKKNYDTNLMKRKKKLPKSLSTEIIDAKIINKKKVKRDVSNSSYSSVYNNNNNKNNRTNFISEDLLNFIDCIKTNQENEKRKENEENLKQKKDVYSFNGIKYKQINTYRENNKKPNKNSSLIVDSFKRIYNYKLNSKNNNNENSKKKIDKNNNSIGKTNKNRNVDYKRLNELYLDYKIKDIRRSKLKNEQDVDSGITFTPFINKKSYRK